MIVPANPLLAGERVHAQGTPVAAVVAESAAAAWDAVALVAVDYDALAGVAMPKAALAPGAPTLFDEAPGNRGLSQTWRGGDPDSAFAGAARVVEVTVQQHLLPACRWSRAACWRPWTSRPGS